ncbi:hypothetical protein BASA60_004448 [Batrachochytrium salamandrivorans]|nr:hypothetical protein BASA60_004448 [Batrachochytrium salamandrivorans]
MSGARHERIIVQTSNTPLINVNVTRLFWAKYCCSCIENMYFPFTFVGNPVSVKFPITNLGLVTSQIQVYVAAGYPISFRFQEEVQIVSGSLSRSRDSATLDYVTLVNLTNSPQQYHIVLSLYFVTTIPLEGEISANSTVYIPIRVDPLLYLTPETKEFIAFGSISVINSNFNLTGFASTQLHGVVNNPIWMEFRKDVPAIKFPRCRVMETLTRTFVIRNKSYTNVVWEGSISEVDDPISENIAGYINSNNLKESSTSAPGIWIPFDLTMTKITLKPFEYCTIDVTIASAKEGDFLCLLKSTYMDSDETIDSDMQNGLLTSYKKHPIGSWLLECSVGLPDITVVPNCLDFGDVAVSDKAERQWCYSTVYH